MREMSLQDCGLSFSYSPKAAEAFLGNIRNVMNFQTLDEHLKCLWLTGAP